MDVIYADNNATTCIAPEVRDAMMPFLTTEYFNPSSMYEQASKASAAVSRARDDVAAMIGTADSHQVVFTSGATESNNTALCGAVKANRKRRHIVTTAVEHPAVLGVCKDLERNGVEVTFLPVDREGCIDTGDFVRALRPDTLLVSIMHANNETGVIFPIGEFARVTKETDPAILFHTDATQTAGKMPLDLDGELKHIDLLSLSGHKFHAPKGVGALFMRRGCRVRPYLVGGHQEDGRRAGTENVPYIAALGRACRLAVETYEEEGRVRVLRDRLESAILDRVPYVEINGRGAPRLPNTLNLACHFVEGEGILYQLSAEGICVSSGSACTSGSLDPSHVLKAMHAPFTAIHGSVRFSLSRYTTDSEVERITEVFPQVIHNLRRLSPYWDMKQDRPRENAPATTPTA